MSLEARHRAGTRWKLAFLATLFVSVIALITLLVSIINGAFGLTAFEVTRQPADLIRSVGILNEVPLEALPASDFVAMLEQNLSSGRGRSLEREQRFLTDRLVFEPEESFSASCASADPFPACNRAARDRQDLYDLVVTDLVEPKVVATYSLLTSIFGRAEVEAAVAAEFPEAVIEFRSWVSSEFLTNSQSSQVETTGVKGAILGSMWLAIITFAFAFPVGVGSAIYLEEFAPKNRFTQILQTNVNNLAGVPSIIYGILGLAVFVRTLEAFTSGQVFGVGTDGGAGSSRTILSGGLTLGLLILPIIIINSQEAIKAVPDSLRRAGMALGATRWQTVRAHVLPSAMPGILTGTILAMARAIGETAPLVVVGASTFLTTDPDGPFSKFTALPMQIFQWTTRPQEEFRNIAAAAILVLLVLLLVMNATAIVLRNRYARKA